MAAMATERLLMRKVREILRLRWERGLKVRQVARSLGVSLGAVSKTEARARHLGLSWAAVELLDDQTLEERLYGRREVAEVPVAARKATEVDAGVVVHYVEEG